MLKKAGHTLHRSPIWKIQDLCVYTRCHNKSLQSKNKSEWNKSRDFPCVAKANPDIKKRKTVFDINTQ